MIGWNFVWHSGTAGCWRLQWCSRGGEGYSCQCNELHRKNCSVPAIPGAAARDRAVSYNTLGLSTMAGFAWIRDWGGCHLPPSPTCESWAWAKFSCKPGSLWGNAEPENPPGYTEGRAAMCQGSLKSHVLLCCSQAKSHTLAHPTSPAEVITGLGYLQLWATGLDLTS